jgi:hypothetical protein
VVVVDGAHDHFGGSTRLLSVTVFFPLGYSIVVLVKTLTPWLPGSLIRFSSISSTGSPEGGSVSTYLPTGRDIPAYGSALVALRQGTNQRVSGTKPSKP